MPSKGFSNIALKVSTMPPLLFSKNSTKSLNAILTASKAVLKKSTAF